MEQKPNICLFDVDGTLTKPRNPISEDMIVTLQKLKQKCQVGVVSGSDLNKVTGQLTQPVMDQMNWVFAENGLYAIKDGKFYEKQSLKEFLGEEKIKKFVNFCLRYIADLDIPIKRGTFVEFRNGMINVSPIGRNCSQEERDQFEIYDNEHNIRKIMIEQLQKEFQDFNLQYSIGGQISFDVFPQGWDKTYCLKYLQDNYNEIRFFGDKTHKGGNDHEIYAHERTVGHSVQTYQETIQQLTDTYKL